MLNATEPTVTSDFDWENGDDAFPLDNAPLVDDRRTEARICAVQALFNVLMMGRHPADVAEEFEKKLNRRKADKKVFRPILEEASNTPERYKTLLEQELQDGWTWDRTDPVLRAVMWAAAAEMTANGDAPVAVLVNEYLNISKGFLQPDEVAFVHRALDSVAKKIRV